MDAVFSYLQQIKKWVPCIKNTICILDQACLIHIYSGVKRNLKRTAVWIHKSSHAFQTPFWSCSSNKKLQLTYYILILTSKGANSKLSPMSLFPKQKISFPTLVSRRHTKKAKIYFFFNSVTLIILHPPSHMVYLLS